MTAVVARVALQLAGDPLERLRVLVDGEDEGKLGHHSGDERGQTPLAVETLEACASRDPRKRARAAPASARVRSETRISSGAAAAMIRAAS